MPRLSLEEKGLLQVLEKLERGEAPLAPSVRFGLASRGLVENEPPALSLLGECVLQELRQRAVRATGEFPALRRARQVGASND